MKKIKEIWDKMKYWQRGCFIGFFFVLVIHIFFFFRFNGYSGLIAIISGLPILLSVLLDKTLSFSDIIPFSVITITFNFVWYTTMGGIVGVLYSYIKNKVKRSTKVNIIILCITIFYFVLTILTYLFIYLYILIPET